MTEEKKEYDWVLKWSSYKDNEMFRAAIKHLDVFPLWRDSKAKVVTKEEFDKMQDEGLAAPDKSYWQIDSGKVGVVAKTYYNQFSNTWNLVSTAFHDFMDGWIACEKKHKIEAMKIQAEIDHTEAIKMNREFNKFGEIREVLRFRCSHCYSKFTIKLGRYEVAIECPNCKAASNYITLIERGGVKC